MKEAGLTGLKNIGRVTAQWLNDVGIYTRQDLEAIGALEAWRRMKITHPRSVTIVGLYALYGAMSDLHWSELPDEIKDELRAEAEE